MNRRSTLFLKAVIVLIALGALFALIRFPQTEGRAANLNLISIYSDPLIIYFYIGSVPFFVALYQAIKLLGFVERNHIFTESAVNTVKKIKYCSLTLSGFVAASVVYIGAMAKMNPHPEDDPAGFVMVGMIAVLLSVIVATAIAVFQKLLQNAVDIKSENDLTV
jgi:hypothetical protein